MALTKYTSTQAKELVIEKGYDDIEEILIDGGLSSDKVSIDLMYLGYLCAKGDIDTVKVFLTRLEYPAEELINMCHTNFNGGTVLHISLYWNSGKLGKDLFELLNGYGATYYENADGELAWEQDVQTHWTDPIDNFILGIRGNSEFYELYAEIRRLYGANISVAMG